jgi:hypothetical protein
MLNLTRMKTDPARLRAALIGYQKELAEVERAIAQLRRRLGLPERPQATAKKPTKKKKR